MEAERKFREIHLEWTDRAMDLVHADEDKQRAAALTDQVEALTRHAEELAHAGDNVLNHLPTGEWELGQAVLAYDQWKAKEGKV